MGKYDKYGLYIKEISFDGQIWTPTDEYSYQLIERNSRDCGYKEIIYSSTTETEQVCEGFDLAEYSITHYYSGETADSLEEYSSVTRHRIVEYMSEHCAREEFIDLSFECCYNGQYVKVEGTIPMYSIDTFSGGKQFRFKEIENILEFNPSMFTIRPIEGSCEEIIADKIEYTIEISTPCEQGNKVQWLFFVTNYLNYDAETEEWISIRSESRKIKDLGVLEYNSLDCDGNDCPYAVQYVTEENGIEMNHSCLPTNGRITCCDDCSLYVPMDEVIRIEFPYCLQAVGNCSLNGLRSLKTLIINKDFKYFENSSMMWLFHLTNITYLGTIEEWNQIERGVNVFINCGTNIVHCTDGDTNLF